MHVTPLAWGITIFVMVAVLVFDLVVIGRRPHEPSMKESGIFVSIYIGLALLFGVGVYFYSGPKYAGEFYAGWLTEYSLSLDNLFIFILIMASLKVPRQLQQFALMVGIVLALILRAIFIAIGAVAIERFSFVFYIFGAFLIYTAVKLVMDYRSHGEESEKAESKLIQFARRHLPFVDEYVGTKLVVKIDGKRVFTAMALVVIALGGTDLLFALDSIPAIYGLTKEPYLVLTANVFALMGLRQLYFLLGGMLKRLVYLSLGLSVILAFIGVKLVLHAMKVSGQYADVPVIGPVMQWASTVVKQLPWGGEIPISVSLGVILGVLAITTVASLIKSGADKSTAPVEGQTDAAITVDEAEPAADGNSGTDGPPGPGPTSLPKSSPGPTSNPESPRSES